jgi:hypothetical protein
VDSSTIVQRTAAGNAELASAAHGLSLTQRRYLTLLDSSCSIDALALRHPAEPEKFERDVHRLLELGLVACVAPLAAVGKASPVTPLVARGSPAFAGRLPHALLALAVVAIAWAGWHSLAPRTASVASMPGTSASRARAAAPDAPSVDPQPIAVRVLRGDPVDRTRETGKEPRSGSAAARTAEPKAGQAQPAKAVPPEPVRTHPALPVERRSPPPEDASAASERGVAGTGRAIEATETRGDPAAPASGAAAHATIVDAAFKRD